MIDSRYEPRLDSKATVILFPYLSVTPLRVDPCCKSWQGSVTGEHFLLLTPKEAAPWEVRAQGSYLVPDSILTDALGAGLLGDTAAFQHDVV